VDDEARSTEFRGSAHHDENTPKKGPCRSRPSHAATGRPMRDRHRRHCCSVTKPGPTSS